MSDKAFAVLGLFDSADALMAAIPQVKARKLGRLETYTPYPIHGMDEALDLRRSPLGGMVLVMGILGAITTLGFEYWMSAVDYPIVTGGKAPWSWEAFIPIMFEVTVLFATFTAGLGMLLLLNKLPFFGHPILASRAIRSITRDRFALAVEADPELARPEHAAGLLDQQLQRRAHPHQPRRARLHHSVNRRVFAGASACGSVGMGLRPAKFHEKPSGHAERQIRPCGAGLQPAADWQPGCQPAPHRGRTS